MKYADMESPIGRLTIAGNDDGLHWILFHEGARAAEPLQHWEATSDCEAITETRRQLQAYFEKRLTRFDLPLRPEGTSFQQDVWRELQKIPYGSVISYGELAKRIGKPNASRAVGAANGSNPIPIVIPCHRVIGGSGKLTGYGGGLRIKQALLELESPCVSSRSLNLCGEFQLH
jgi:methylated-DNA-[protein]-cysteine S-methyltransferase